jgi:hypothetical protein
LGAGRGGGAESGAKSYGASSESDMRSPYLPNAVAIF